MARRRWLLGPELNIHPQERLDFDLYLGLDLGLCLGVGAHGPATAILLPPGLTVYVPTGPVRRLGPGGTAAVASRSPAMAPPPARPQQAARPSSQVRNGWILRGGAGVSSPGLGDSEAGNRRK